LPKGNSTLLVKDGLIDTKALQAAHMSVEDLQGDLRENGVSEPSQAKEARLERSGKLSVIKK